MIKLLSRDKKIVEASKDAMIGMSVFISDIFENCSESNEEIPIYNFDESILIKLIELIEHEYKNKCLDVKQLKRATKYTTTFAQMFISGAKNVDWYVNFMSGIDDKDLPTFMNACDFFMVKQELLELACANFAFRIIGRSPEDIRKMFGFDNDQTPDETKKSQSEHLWFRELSLDNNTTS